MIARFKNLIWEKGTVSFLTRNDYNCMPQNAVRTANGTYMVSSPAKLYLTILSEDGRTITADIANVVRNINGWEKISTKRYNNLRARLEGKSFQLDENDNIIGLGGIVLF